jgi:hypothetical protein
MNVQSHAVLELDLSACLHGTSEPELVRRLLASGVLLASVGAFWAHLRIWMSAGGP